MLTGMVLHVTLGATPSDTWTKGLYPESCGTKRGEACEAITAMLELVMIHEEDSEGGVTVLSPTRTIMKYHKPKR
jgi:hypothetical protein